MTNPWSFDIWIELVLVTLTAASLIGFFWPNSVFAVEYFRIFARRRLDLDGETKTRYKVEIDKEVIDVDTSRLG